MHVWKLKIILKASFLACPTFNGATSTAEPYKHMTPQRVWVNNNKKDISDLYILLYKI